MSSLFRCTSIRALENEAQRGLPAGALMQRAAAAVAASARVMLRELRLGTRVLALVGPGNNGGDALLAARMLADTGVPCDAIAWVDAPAAGSDAERVWARWHEDGRRLAGPADFTRLVGTGPLVIDGLFGIGLARPIEGVARGWIEAINAARLKVLAIDAPSGIDADRGTVVGERHGVAIRAAVTVTMIGDKPGLHTGDAVEYAGRIEVAPLDDTEVTGPLAALPAATANGTCAPVRPGDGTLVGAADVASMIPLRTRNAHKGRFGSTLVIGGASGMGGAVLLAGLGAQAVGAGKVFLSRIDRVRDATDPPHLMHVDAAGHPDRDRTRFDAAAIGCGLGRAAPARRVLDRWLVAPLPMVIDADALNLIAAEPARRARLAARTAPTVLTPHPLEAARLLACSTAQILEDRIGAACELARSTGAIALLKGAGTVIASPAGDWAIIGSGAPALAVAGSGDVLAGAIAALLAQGRTAAQSAILAAWLHGRAGERWQARHPAGIGLAAGDIPALMCDEINLLARGASS